MLALKFNDTGDIMKKLLATDLFDSFLLSEAAVTTFTSFAIDGSWHPEYFGGKAAVQEKSGASAEQQSSPSWALIRPVMFQIIKGHHTPISFKVVMKLPDGGAKTLFHNYDNSFEADKVTGLFLNIIYKNDAVICTTGTSMKEFTLDKTAEHVWDADVQRFFVSKHISVSEEI